ncbi:hypothetical protein [Salinibacterium sp. PAMC 21357]|uniref:hypothetical protein n=1 Tax=Salinibacterium sp. PAMC 21357 TaxID=1112215 RepID=UPI00031D6B45|nr:hypothetical protein [Salinibacterium sp. PAMC 21357]
MTLLDACCAADRSTDTPGYVPNLADVNLHKYRKKVTFVYGPVLGAPYSAL